ncbi:MAG TPA: hypothetical protein VEB21_05080 [Terriglobales bacterium]|nr:hypothetical protein [Terriglobales bacterium]
MIAFLRAPLDDYLAALTAAAAQPRALWLLLFAAVLSWWLYVPVHELLHAYGCLWSGGEVTRLEIDAIYGAALLQRWFPFVAVGSEYAGQLTGFDTHGSDWIYLATDALPFLLTVVLGVPLLRAAAQAAPAPAALQLGAAIPIAFAPFISLTGDYYEMASILISKLAAAVVQGTDPSRWRSDDLFLLLERLGELSALDVTVVGTAVLLSALLAWGTYWLGRGVARIAGLGPWGVDRHVRAI